MHGYLGTDLAAVWLVIDQDLTPLAAALGRMAARGFIAGLARQPQLAGRNVTINNLLSGAFDTDRLRTTMST